MRRFLAPLAVLLLAACTATSSAPVSAPPTTSLARLDPSLQGEAGDDWTSPGGDVGKTRFSTLAQINAGNVGSLGLAWQAELGTNRGLEATPVVIGGVMYTSGVAGRVYAFDAASGRELWRFEPEVEMQVNRSVCCDQVNRGVAVVGGRVFVAALDAKLYALDAKTGRVLWQADTVEDKARGINSTGAPEVAGDVVVIGNGGGDDDVRGYVSAYDVRTGQFRWRFHVVPHDPKLGPQDNPDMEAALKTWDPNSRWDIGGGGAPWDGVAYDPETNAIYVGTGNGEPYGHLARSPTDGDNLYLSSIVALDPATGRVKWHYQEAPGDQWDYDATSPFTMTHMTIDGADVPVLIHAPKNGFLYLLDRRNGKVLRASPLVRINWADGVDLKTGRPRLTPHSSDYAHGPQIVFPGTPGARNWYPASYDRLTGHYVSAVLDMGNLLFIPPGPKPYQPKGLNTGAVLIFTSNLVDAMPTLPPPVADQIRALPAYKSVVENPASAELRAIDPLTGRTVWSVPTGGWQDRGGVLTTAGGITVTGTVAGHLKVLDSRTGKLLKDIDTGTSIIAAPMTYRVGGVQYIAVMAAWGGGGYPFVPRYSAAYDRGNMGRLLVFRLGGGAVPIPEKLPPLEVAPEPPAQLPGVTPATLAEGRALFFTNCVICHSNQHRAITPDLRRMAAPTHEHFDDIVMKGLLVQAGMPRWDDALSADQAKAIHAYLIDLQGQTRKNELALVKAGKPLDAPSLAILSSY